MKTVDFAKQYVKFNRSSPISGAFNLSFYPFLEKPLNAADDISCKRLVIYKASSCLGTVLGQIINSKRIVCDVGDQKMVCQSDDDAELWTKTRGKEWLRSIPDAMRLLSRDKYAITNNLWLFRHKFLELSGPGINSAQSVQVRYLQSDESHLEAFEPGRLIEFEKRMGARWDRQATHITTAPDSGKEIDTFFLAGQQDEWHFRCPHCNYLVWPLWGKQDRYNGEQVFYRDDDGAVFFLCPNCNHYIVDTARGRYDLATGGDYVAQNPNALPETRSFRWNVFAAHWIPWRETAIEHKAAIEEAKLGNLKPLEDVTKKRFCMQWTPHLPDFGDERGTSNYKIGDVWVTDDSVRILSADFQAGKGSEGAHLWNLVTQWDRGGNSRRLEYRRVDTFSQMEATQHEFGVENKNVYCDSGYENRLVFRECGKRKWYCTRGSERDEIQQTITHVKNGEHWRLLPNPITHPMPFSDPEPQSGIIGEQQPSRLKGVNFGRLPEGWAYCIVLANPTLYGYLCALVGGSSGRYFGIASDFPVEYVSNMPAFIPTIIKDKMSREKVLYKKIREDHAWDCEILGLVGAVRAGYYPIGRKEVTV